MTGRLSQCAKSASCPNRPEHTTVVFVTGEPGFYFGFPAPSGFWRHVVCAAALAHLILILFSVYADVF